MLSPSMTTKSKRNSVRQVAISPASSNWSFAPVPLSPITAKRTDFGFIGNFSVGPAAKTRLARMKRGIRRRIGSRNRVTDEIDYQVSFHIAENQVMAHHPILEFRGQGRQVQQ